MNRSQNRITDLLKIYTEGRATPDEERELFNLIEIERDEEIIKGHVKQILLEYTSDDQVPAADWERLYQKIIAEKSKQSTYPLIRRVPWPGWAAAAIILLIGTGYYFFAHKEQGQQQEIAKVEQIRVSDIPAPNTTNAVLTLANGQKIILDSSRNGIVAAQGAMNVVKLADGQIAYQGESKDVQYNTLSNPRGSKVVSLVLADGSKVWLNTESSLTYPTAFLGKERNVKITGEAYFEIAHNADMPFIVSKGETSIKVLGTHFNVNAYDDESLLKVTLLEGSVSVNAAVSQQPKVIRPGEQARVNREGAVTLAGSVDLQEVMAWKNDLFSFKGENIESVMRQISRWYNVEVIFKEPITEKFYAEVSKSTGVSTLLEMLEATKSVHFKIKDDTIFVTR